MNPKDPNAARIIFSYLDAQSTSKAIISTLWNKENLQIPLLVEHDIEAAYDTLDMLLVPSHPSNRSGKINKIWIGSLLYALRHPPGDEPRAPKITNSMAEAEINDPAVLDRALQNSPKLADAILKWRTLNRTEFDTGIRLPRRLY